MDTKKNPVRRAIACLSGLFLTVILAPHAGALPSFQLNGSTLVMSNGNVRVEYHLNAGNANFYWSNSLKISNFYSGVGLNTAYIKGTSYSSWNYAIAGSNQVVVTGTGAGLPAMKQYFTFDQNDSFLIRLDVTGTGLQANWMGPVVVDSTGIVDIGITNDNRALVVPFDNDGFVSYNAGPMNSSATGYEVAAFYDNTSRNGLVVGSVTHDTWKTGIFFNGTHNKLTQMNVFGGATSPWDVDPHGYISGNTISSPTMFVGFGSDWRVTMQNFAAENTNFVPRLAWTNGVPFGWNSWGVYQQNVTYAEAIEVSDYFAVNLMNHNFSDNGTVYINLDSYWDNLTPQQLQTFTAHCHAHGEKAGIYFGPFVWFGSANQSTNWSIPGSTWHYSDALLRDHNGNFESVDGGLAMDPTHPGTRDQINYYINLFTNWGFDYVKLDFLSHGTYEGVHYDPTVTTGIQAYNQGMQYVLNAINGRMFISESIAPLFPYQYAHSRRISCDAGTSLIGNTAYVMNSTSYGWWLDNLYQFNDPDIMVFGNGADTNQAQSRVISGAVTGLMLDGDDLTSASGQLGAQTSLTNASVDNVARVGRSFMPVEGNTGTSAVNQFVRQDGSTWQLAVFNYTSNSASTTVNLSRVGLPAGYYILSNLWDRSVSTVNGSFGVSLNACQSKLFSLTARTPGSLRWSGSGSATWDAGTSVNWINQTNSQSTVFLAGDQVLFDDTGANTSIGVSGTVQPSAVTVSSSVNAYTLNGPGTLSTSGSFIKNGSSALTMFVPANITGPVQINGGSVYAGNFAFASAASITITNNSTLDFGGGTMGNGTPITVSGTGVAGEGALYNSSYETYGNLLYVTLAGNTTFGGTSRWDFGPGSTVTGPYKIIINRTSGVYGEWSGVSLNNNVGDIELASGKLGIKSMGSNFGNPAANFIVDPGTELDFWTGETGYAKNFQVQSGGKFQILTGFTNFNGNFALADNALFAAYGGTGSNEVFGGTFVLNGNVHFQLGNGNFYFTNVISGTGGYVWDVFDHTLVFNASNTYGGPTVIGSGLGITLSGNGSISHSSLIFFGGSTPANVSLDASGRTDGTLTLANGQTLGGIGTVNGRLAVQPGATIAPAGTNSILGLIEGTNSTGSLAASSDIILNGTAYLKLNGSGVSDEVVSATKIAYGGVLSVTNISGVPLAAGNSFQLFNAPSLTGSFASINPATPGAGLAWDTSHLNSGVLQVVAAPAPVITNARMSASHFILSGTNGTVSGNYVVLVSTNLGLPLASWVPLVTNVFDTGGGFNATNVIPSGMPQLFYRIQPK